MQSSWPLWMLLFGIYFPERIPYDRRWPALKWLLVAPMIGVISANLLVGTPALETFPVVQALRQLVERYRAVLVIVGMVSIGTFFANLHVNLGMASSPDARRRLRLMLAGMHLSMTPTFALVIWALSRDAEIFAGVSPGILLPSLLLLCLFPVTMAYVIVVQRAMDVRVVLRQGVQYAFARGGLVGLRLVVSAAIVAAMMLLSSRLNTPRWQVFAIFATGVFFLSVLGRLARWLVGWIDRRFFREAYNAEQILTELSERVRTIVQAQPLLETISRNIADSLHVERIATLLDDGSGYRMAYALGYPVTPDVGFGLGDATVEHLRRVQKPARVYFDDETNWVQGSAGPGEEERGRIRSLETQLLLPLSVQDKLLGFIALGPKQSEQPYTNSDLRLLHSVATQAGLALENTQLTAKVASEVAQRERINRELEIAREVQERLFPQSLPEVSGLDYSGACRPALGVGGDYYDFLALPGGKLGIAIGDVSGKGVAAALLMASLQASLRGQTMGGPRQLADLMCNVNRLVYEASGSNRYATFFYAQYESATRELTFVNAGHNPPVVLRGSGEARQVLRLKAGGTVVGLLPAYAYQQETIKLQPGDTIIAFTDGISEAMNGSEEEWGEERMIEAAWSCRDKPAADMIIQLMIGADAFAAGAAQHDDMTLVVAQIV